MPRANVYLPADLHERARAAGLNVSELTQRAIEQELERRDRRTAMNSFFDERAEEHGPATDAERMEAEQWAASVLDIAQRSARGDKKRSRQKKRQAS